MNEERYLWVVSDWADKSRAMPEKQALSLNRIFVKPTPNHAHVFDTELEASTFIIARAAEKVADAEKELKSAQNRLRKCHKKFGNRA